MKVTAKAPSNIAFIKYWGKKDEILRLPANGSVSVNLSNLNTTTTVEFSKSLKQDIIIIDGVTEEKDEKRITKHLDRIRKLADIKTKAKVVSQNNFPIGSGLASSASGFAALSVAGAKAAGLSLSEKELSILARQGSGSACRSIPDGFVEWLDSDTSETSYAVSLYPPDHWQIAIIVAVVGSEKKDVGSTEAQERTFLNPFFPVRISRMNEKIKKIKKYISLKNFPEFGELVESEALELHAITLTSTPPILYWLPGTIAVMRLAMSLRKEGLPVYFTIDAGPHVHLICEKQNVEKIADKLKNIPEIKKTIINFPAFGAKTIDNHLF